MKKYFILISVLIFLCSSRVFSQGLTVVCVEESRLYTDNPVQNLRWSSDGEMFSYDERYFIHLSDAVRFKNLYKLTFTDTVGSTFYRSNLMESSFYMAINNQGRLGVWDLNIKKNMSSYESDVTLQIGSGGDIVVSRCSSDGMYIATVDSTGHSDLYFYLRMTSDLLKLSFSQNITSDVYSVAFSPNNRMVLYAAKDGSIDVYDTYSRKPVKEIKTFAQTSVEPIFSGDNNFVIHLRTPSSIQLTSITEDKSIIMNTSSAISAVSILPGTNYLAVQPVNGEIMIYSIDDGVFLGTIPSFDDSKMTSYAFSRDGQYILQGFEDGSIHKIKLYIATLEELEAQGISPSRTAFGERNYAGTYTYLDDGLMIYAGPGVISQSNYLWSVNLGAFYQLTSLVNPLCTGAKLDVMIGFPSKEYDQTYTTYSGTLINPPYFLCTSLQIPIGIYYQTKDKNVIIGADMMAGCRMFALLGISNRKYASSKIHFAPSFGGIVFVYFKNFGGNFEVNYDPTFGFITSLDVGYRITLPSADGMIR